MAALVVQRCRGCPTHAGTGSCQRRFEELQVWSPSELKTQPPGDPPSVRQLNTVILDCLGEPRGRRRTISIKYRNGVLAIQQIVIATLKSSTTVILEAAMDEI